MNSETKPERHFDSFVAKIQAGQRAGRIDANQCDTALRHLAKAVAGELLTRAESQYVARMYYLSLGSAVNQV